MIKKLCAHPDCTNLTDPFWFAYCTTCHRVHETCDGHRPEGALDEVALNADTHPHDWNALIPKCRSCSNLESPMHAIPTCSPTNVAALDARDPEAGGASHTYGIQWGGPQDMTIVQFQHGARGVAGSTPGVFDDDLLAIVQDRLEAFQAGPFACGENEDALEAVRTAREKLSARVARRMAKGVLGANEKH